MNIQEIINNYDQKHVLVVGDVVLDQYIQGSVSRISPEAPVPVVHQEKKFYTTGGAANVANNLTSLGAEVTLVGQVGDDLEGDVLKSELTSRNIHAEGIFVNKSIDTIIKTRIIAQRQQLVRLDRETPLHLQDNSVLQSECLPFIEKTFDQYDGVIISDYGKGMITPEVVSQLCQLARSKNVPIVVDPKVEHFQDYGEVTSITPNKKEAENALKAIPQEIKQSCGITSSRLDSLEVVDKAGAAFLKYLNIDSILITLGEQGMYLFEKDQDPFLIPTRAKEVFDVSGAGDTVISVFALSLATGADKKVAADIANHAAGVVVGKMGAVAIAKDELLEVIER